MKGTLRLFLTLCMAVLSMTLVQAQERTYSGVVKGSDGLPIIGASVEVVGTLLVHRLALTVISPFRQNREAN